MVKKALSFFVAGVLGSGSFAFGQHIPPVTLENEVNILSNKEIRQALVDTSAELLREHYSRPWDSSSRDFYGIGNHEVKPLENIVFSEMLIDGEIVSVPIPNPHDTTWRFRTYMNESLKGRLRIRSSEVMDLLVADGFDEKYISALFADNRFRFHPQAFDFYKKRPKTRLSKEMSYATYARRLGLPRLKKQGAGFIARHWDVLYDAGERYSVDPFFVAAIIGVESHFGNNMGRYTSLNALVSLSSYDPSGFANSLTSEFFYFQLQELLHFCLSHDVDPFSLSSSYAGATSWGQFMPSSLNDYFVSFNDDVFDVRDMDDCIYSVAHYFRAHDWDNTSVRHGLDVTHQNYWTIYSYNRSSKYIRAVDELAESLRSFF